jgi:hypothetical protein
MMVPPSFPIQYQGQVLGILQLTLPDFAYGALTLFCAPFQATSAIRFRVYSSPTTPHFPQLVAAGFGLDFAAFVRH